MKQIVISVPDKKYPSFIELINSLEYVTVNDLKKNTKKDAEHPVLKSLRQGLKEVELVKKGKLKSRPLKDFLDEV